jgi:hypothetical protein
MPIGEINTCSTSFYLFNFFLFKNQMVFKIKIFTNWFKFKIIYILSDIKTKIIKYIGFLALFKRKSAFFLKKN